MTDVAPPAQSAVAAAAVAKSGGPAPAFSDADGAQKFINTLALLKFPQAYERLLKELNALAAAELPARERAKIAEVLREQVLHLHTELARRYAGKPQPEGEREAESVDQAIALWQALWEQYSACLKPLLEGDAELAGVRAKILQRGLYVGKQLILVHGLARRGVPPALWQELHAYYRIAEMLESSVAAVTDELMPQAIGTSCYSVFGHALLLALADPCEMTVRQIELTDRWLGLWARKLFPYVQERETEGAVILVDLESSQGAAIVPVTPKDAPASMRYGYPGKLATSVRGRLKRLGSGANPAELQLGHDISVEQAVALLTHLDLHWCQAPRAMAAAENTALELVTGGMSAAYFRVGGRTFERREQKESMARTFLGAQHLQTLDALTDYDRFKEDAERSWPWERWKGRYAWREATLGRDKDSQYRWMLDQLVVIRDDERTRAGFVSRVAREDGGLALALKLWPGSPRSIAVRPQSLALSSEAPMPALMLAETPEERPMLLLPPRAFTAGRVIKTAEGPERKFRLTRLVQRGADFERVAYEEFS